MVFIILSTSDASDIAYFLNNYSRDVFKEEGKVIAHRVSNNLSLKEKIEEKPPQLFPRA